MMKSFIKILFCSLILVGWTVAANAARAGFATDTLRLNVYFQKDKAVFDPGFRDNGKNIQEFCDQLAAYLQDEQSSVSNLIIRATASPEGSFSHNMDLSSNRAWAIYNYLTGVLAFDSSLFVISGAGEDWEGLAEAMQQCSEPWAAEVLDIIRNTPGNPASSEKAATARKNKIKELEGGKVWKYLNDEVFPDLRHAGGDVAAIVEHPAEPVAEPEPEPELEPEPEPEVEPEPVVEQVVAEPKPVVKPERDFWEPNMYVYNNLALDFLLVANLGIEIDVAPHVSVAMPVMYSGWNYFRSTAKFRCAGIRPEIRWWPTDGHFFYVGAHGEIAYWNVAVDGVYRYQDTDAKSPLYGGGADLGFRITLADRLYTDISAGAGICYLDYDQFINQPNGRLSYTHQTKWYYGPDFVQISLVYKFSGKK